MTKAAVDFGNNKAPGCILRALVILGTQESQFVNGIPATKSVISAGYVTVTLFSEARRG